MVPTIPGEVVPALGEESEVISVLVLLSEHLDEDFSGLGELFLGNPLPVSRPVTRCHLQEQQLTKLMQGAVECILSMKGGLSCNSEEDYPLSSDWEGITLL